VQNLVIKTIIKHCYKLKQNKNSY